jgi:hypothetical protein
MMCLVKRKRREQEISFVMLSGDFGQQIKKDILIQKWKMNLYFLKTKSSNVLKKGILKKIFNFLVLALTFIQSC